MINAPVIMYIVGWFWFLVGVFYFMYCSVNEVVSFMTM